MTESNFVFRASRWFGRHPEALFCLALVSMLAAGCTSSRQSFYPIGIYSVSDTNDLETIRAAGFNVVAGQANRGYLNAAHQANLKVLASPHTSAGPRFNATAARRAVSTLDAHPALWAWYLIDEPDLNHVDPNDVIQANRFVKRVGARKPTALVLFQGYSALHYAGITDLLMIDRYPVPWLPLANFPQHVRMARLGLGKEKPLIAVIQAFDWSYYPDLLPNQQELRPPTETEIRCMTYSALAHRATGLFYYCFNDRRWNMKKHPATWQALTSVVAEVNRRLPLFQAEHLWWPYVHTFADPKMSFNAALESSVTPALLRVKSGTEAVPAGDYILAVNNTPQKLIYAVDVPRPDAVALPVLDEDRLVPIINGWLQDTFEPYAVHVYGPLGPEESNRND